MSILWRETNTGIRPSKKTLKFFSESGARRRRCFAAERGEAPPQKKPMER